MKKNKNDFLVAYLSMEIALEDSIKSFAGGLGVLAGDMLRAASQINFPMIGISLLNKNGYFKQKILKDGKQEELKDESDFSKLKLNKTSVVVNIGDEKVLVWAWEYALQSLNGLKIPVFLLDTDWPENSQMARALSGSLYGGDIEYRLKQEIILGRAGVKMIEALGFNGIKKIHLNEGHGALAAIELFNSSNKKTDKEKIREVNSKIVFTTHTPIPEAHDIFFGEFFFKFQSDFPKQIDGLIENDKIDMTKIAMIFSSYDNAVSLQHRKTSHYIFKGFDLEAITNGVDSGLWTSDDFASLYDKYIPNWRVDNSLFKKAKHIPLVEIEKTHNEAKKKMIEFLNTNYSCHLKNDIFTIVFARRFAPYKRPSFILADIEKLLEINKNFGALQIIFAGKAHPRDVTGKALIEEVNAIGSKLSKDIPFLFIENYNIEIAKKLVAGADLWLNNPIPPLEASGTSGMKAAHNGVPQLSTLDGWWPEGYIKNKTGWAIREIDNKSNFYNILGKEIIPLYYGNRNKYSEFRRYAISLNAAKFNAQRMLKEYIKKAYRIKNYL
jgi:starch phosphorylase